MVNDNHHYTHTLPEGYILDNFEIIRVLGVGGFGIAYLAKDTYLDEECVIKEYMPNAFAYRDATIGTVNPSGSNNVDTYQWGLNEFLNEAKTIKKCQHHNIVEVIRFFEANNTAYIVMPYLKGDSLSDLLRKSARKTLSEQEIKEIVIPLLEGLKTVHAKNIFHRDIKLSNIYICAEDHTPILIDFGSARFSLGEHSRSLTTILTPGYSPHEQYHRHGKQGAWTDIYSMGAVMYCLISGQKPTEAPARVIEDPLVPAVEVGKGKYSVPFLTAIDHALAVKESDRPQSTDQWLVELKHKIDKKTDDENTNDENTDDDTIIQTPIHTTSIDDTNTKHSNQTKNKRSTENTFPITAWIVIILLLIGIAVLATKVFFDSTDKTSHTKNEMLPTEKPVNQPQPNVNPVDLNDNESKPSDNNIKEVPEKIPERVEDNTIKQDEQDKQGKQDNSKAKIMALIETGRQFSLNSEFTKALIDYSQLPAPKGAGLNRKIQDTSSDKIGD